MREEMGALLEHSPPLPFTQEAGSALGKQEMGLISHQEYVEVGVLLHERRQEQSGLPAMRMNECLIMILSLDATINCSWAKGRRPNQGVYNVQTRLHVNVCAFL